MEVHYVVGDGLAVGAGRRWLLLSRVPSDALVEELFEAVRSSEPLSEVVARVVATDPELGVAAVDATVRPPARHSHGAAQVDPADGTLRLTLGSDSHATARAHRLVSGVAPAAELRLTGVDAGTGHRLIDGIPREILDAAGPDGPPPRRPRLHSSRGHSGPAVTADPTTGERAAGPAVPAPAPQYTPFPGEGTGEHPAATTGPRPTGAPVAGTEPESATVVRAPLGAGLPPVPDEPDAPESAGTPEVPAHLQSGTVASVLAVWCPAGHPTPVAAPTCRVCRAPVAPQQAREIPRPVLGGLRLPTGEVVPLDRGVVIGRRPAPLPGAEDWPHLVHLAPDLGFVSRLHLQLELDGWLVLARDLSSRGGTTLTPPGRPGFRMQAQEPYALEPGTVLNLAELYAVRFEVGPEVVA